jgi:ubiquinone/menaquinone biosynthesis C-methylase UbiE
MAEAASKPLRVAIDTVSAEFASSLGPNGVAFLRRTYANGLEPYQRRLAAVGLGSGERLLDAGCGLGQWSFAAAMEHDDVVGVDVSEARVAACSRLSHLSGLTNCSFHQASLECLPFADATFDSVVSYSVLYFTDFALSLTELARILRPGGKLYFSTNDIGRFVVDIIENPNPAPDFYPRLYGLATIARTILERLTGKRWFAGAVAMSERRTALALKRAGFEILEIGPEGTLGLGDKPMQRGQYAGITAVFDVLARRK